MLTRRSAIATRAIAIAQAHLGDDVEIIRGEFGDPRPDLERDGLDALLSFLSPWVVPGRALERAPVALNVHPGPPAYPGIGCYNFALYDGAKRYGCVCHRMAPRLDTGEIVALREFDIASDETVASLQRRTLELGLKLFADMCARLAAGESIEPLGQPWQREPYTRADLEALCRVTPDMSADEIRRRVHAVSYPGRPGAFIELGGVRFVVPSPPPSSD